MSTLTLRGLVLAIAVVAACANSSEIHSTTSSGSGASGGSGGTGGSGGSEPVGDSIPTGAVAFFENMSCPEGWDLYPLGNGRYLMPTVGGATPGATYGEPLENGEDRTHQHDVTESFALSSVSYAGVASGGNHGVAMEGTGMLATTSDAVSVGLPYIQLLICKKMAKAVPRSTPLPSGMLMFFDAPACPPEWQQSAVTQGRFVVGLPENAPADLAYGGGPLSAAEMRSHQHGTTAILQTAPHGIALASGCCGSGYAGNGIYASMDDTGAAESGAPFLELLHCQKM